MTARSRRREQDTQYRGGSRGPGYAASSMENECRRCGDDIEDWRQATKVGGRWVHKRCAGGGDDG